MFFPDSTSAHTPVPSWALGNSLNWKSLRKDRRGRAEKFVWAKVSTALAFPSGRDERF